MIGINTERATELLLALHRAYVAKSHLYRHVSIENAVQHVHIPDAVEKGSMEHIQWLFFATLTDRRQVSEEVYRAHVLLREKYPHLYTEQVLTMKAVDLANILIQYKVGIPRQSAEYWIRCAATFWGMWKGDPRLLYQGGSIQSALKWKNSFAIDPLPGYGPKITSLFGLYLSELGEVILLDAFPVDIHVQRWFLSTDCITGIAGNISNAEMEERLRPFLTDFCISQDVSWIDLSHAIWFLGNRVCTGCPRNKAANLVCPSYSACGGALDSKTYFTKGFWTLNERFRRGGDYTGFVCPTGPLFGS